MDANEKIEKLNSFCDKQESCYDCPIGKAENDETFGCCFLDMDNSRLDRLYNIAFPDEPVDMVNHPPHYQGKYECIDEMIALFGVEAVKAFCKCNVYKYRFRAANKNGQEDLDKADFYMDYLMKLEKQQ